MKSEKKIYAMIPARIGSQRLKYKNLAMICGKPLIYYAIESAKKSKVFDRIIINSDHEVFSKIAKRYNVEFYKRPHHLGSSKTRSDDVVADFMENFSNGNIVAWVNSIAPLQDFKEISKVINFFVKNDFDSLITVKKNQVHSIINNNPINFIKNSSFALTQELESVYTFVYSMMVWKRNFFLNSYKKNGYAIMNGKFGTYPVSELSSIIVKNKYDLNAVDFLLKTKNINNDKIQIKYDDLINNLKNS